MIRNSSFSECLPKLNILWPKRNIAPIDNHAGLIEFSGDEIYKTAPKYYVYELNNSIVGTTHAYWIGIDKLRLRGTWVDPSFRKRGIGRQLINQIITDFSDATEIITFPREGTEKFYQSLGFEILSNAVSTLNSKNNSGWAILRKSIS